jgi:PKD repeat protein
VSVEHPIARARSLGLGIALAAAGMALAAASPAATYRPMSDADLVAAAPLVVRARVRSVSVRLDPLNDDLAPFTLVSLEPLETFKGSIGGALTLRLPGGRDGDRVWWIPGVPVFAAGEDVVLMLSADDRNGEYRLTELGLSKFEVLADASGRRFIRRSVFSPSEDLAVSKREPVSGGPAAREAESFFAFLRAAARGETPAPVSWIPPASSPSVRPKWINLGGQEPGDCDGSPCLFRWFWDTGDSPPAVVSVNGTQSNLNTDDRTGCFQDSICGVQKAVDGWRGVAQSDVRYSGLSSPGNVTVSLDAERSFDGGAAWRTPIGCEGGVIGLGGPTLSAGTRTFRGDPNYEVASGGRVSMRKDTCATGYSAQDFRTAVLHELGHTLGLGHPDQVGESLHSTTEDQDIRSAVMDAVVSAARPKVPQTDDIQAIQYYYGTAPVGPLPQADFAFGVGDPSAPNGFYFYNTTPDATACKWDFGDSGSSDNVIVGCSTNHGFSHAGRFTVTLIAANSNGSGIVSKAVDVAAAPCDAGPDALCLNGGRFRVSMTWQKTNGASGSGTAVGLTADSGYFWFFDPSNIETIVKVLNGCGIGGHYWVFAAGLTNVQSTLTVLDLESGTTRQYDNPQGTAFAPIQDTSAFSSCP